ncbi:helix-turn-helix transcriptional regulator [Scytonema sp. PRP1]|uniref:helix-turn-helix transcriptional regulator n=1 Tax=Scytonema sp. PRP1 TaxID=3120513 RepID=UPI002FD6E198
MSSKTDTNYNQIAFALEILKQLAQKPRNRDELADLLSPFVEAHGKSSDEMDIKQKLTRTIRKLRDCGIEIKSAPHHPYELVESNFPVILSTEQRQALALAAYFFAGMGFSAQASQILRIGNLKESDIPAFVKVNFSPPVDYTEDKLDVIVRHLQQRFEQQRRYTITYQSRKGGQRIWDVDRSELRFHNGVLYLFAFIPDWKSWRFQTFPNIDQNHLFRVDRIANVGPASDVHWLSCEFPKLEIYYRMSGDLANYQPRREGERVINRDSEGKFVDIATLEDYWFWFRQRMLQYGANVQVLTPEFLAKEIKNEHQKAYEKYCS